ncbi:MAG: HAMP domain-containing methyl-accepting chemotaxis protein, partial [Zavarzinia sp.]|nr:HAMP domain-containing methyl-accepting chemotaxis protein [Zavarzinia sp.]
MSIHRRIVLLLVAFGFLPALILYGIYAVSEGQSRDALFGRFHNLADQAVDSVDRSLAERYGDVQSFALNAALYDADNWGNAEYGNPLIEAINGYIAAYDVYRLMVVVDTEGVVIAVNTKDAEGRRLETKALLGTDQSGSEWFKAVSEGHFLQGRNGLTGTYVAGPSAVPLVAKVTGDDGYALTFAASVKPPGGRTIAYWVSFSDVSFVASALSEYYKHLAQDGLTSADLAVLDGAGRVIARFDGAGLHPAHDDMTANGPGTDLVHKALAGESGAEVVATGKGGDQVFAYAHSEGAGDFPGLGWSSTVRVDTEQVFAGLDRLALLMLITLVATAVITTGAGYVVGRGISSPIRAMVAVMGRLAGGDHKVVVPSRGRRDEIGAMAEAVEVFKQAAIENDRLAAAAEEARRREEDERERNRREEARHNDERRAREEHERAEEERRRTQATEAERAAAKARRAEMHALADTFQSTVQDVVQAVAAAANELQHSATLMTALAEDSSTKAGHVAESAGEASTNVQTVATAAEELAASVREISARVTQSASTASQAVSQANSTNQSM